MSTIVFSSSADFTRGSLHSFWGGQWWVHPWFAWEAPEQLLQNIFNILLYIANSQILELSLAIKYSNLKFELNQNKKLKSQRNNNCTDQEVDKFQILFYRSY